MADSVSPGATQLTRILNCAQSSASARVNPTTAAFEVTYPTSSFIACSPAREETLTMQPFFCGIMLWVAT
ncbi:MAG TPA: hypothetical protein VEO55_10530, partial [Candidatus Dormibacteraeota bacterium]|nr:hypothetical protein [Candidatus Dormibacteraeota bacterium]